MRLILSGNPNLREVVAAARELGVEVEFRNGTGELKFCHPSFGRTYLVNSRRKDSPRVVLVALRKLAMEVMP